MAVACVTTESTGREQESDRAIAACEIKHDQKPFGCRLCVVGRYTEVEVYNYKTRLERDYRLCVERRALANGEQWVLDKHKDVFARNPSVDPSVVTQWILARIERKLRKALTFSESSREGRWREEHLFGLCCVCDTFYPAYPGWTEQLPNYYCRRCKDEKHRTESSRYENVGEGD